MSDTASQFSDDVESNDGWEEMGEPQLMYEGELDDAELFVEARDCILRHPSLKTYLDEKAQGNEHLVENLTRYVDHIFEAILQTEDVKDKKTRSGKDADAVRLIKGGHWDDDQIRLTSWKIVILAIDIQAREEVGVEVYNVRTQKYERTITKMEYDDWESRLKDVHDELWFQKSMCKNWLDADYKDIREKIMSNVKAVSATKEANGKSNEIRRNTLQRLAETNAQDDANADDNESSEEPEQKTAKKRKRQSTSKRRSVKRNENVSLKSEAEEEELPQHGDEFSITNLSSFQPQFDASTFPTSNMPVPASEIEHPFHDNNGAQFQPRRQLRNKIPASQGQMDINGSMGSQNDGQQYLAQPIMTDQRHASRHICYGPPSAQKRAFHPANPAQMNRHPAPFSGPHSYAEDMYVHHGPNRVADPTNSFQPGGVVLVDEAGMQQSRQSNLHENHGLGLVFNEQPSSEYDFHRQVRSRHTVGAQSRHPGGTGITLSTANPNIECPPTIYSHESESDASLDAPAHSNQPESRPQLQRSNVGSDAAGTQSAFADTSVSGPFNQDAMKEFVNWAVFDEEADDLANGRQLK